MLKTAHTYYPSVSVGQELGLSQAESSDSIPADCDPEHWPRAGVSSQGLTGKGSTSNLAHML